VGFTKPIPLIYNTRGKAGGWYPKRYLE